VIPLQISGGVNTDLTNITSSELLESGLSNMCASSEEPGYFVRHSRKPVNDFGRPPKNNLGPGMINGVDRPNLFERAFPCLYPYGVGGIESSDQIVEVDFGSHVRWALQYCDRRFRKHETFPFLAFGILQRRQALGSARVQMQRKTFEKDAQILSTITTEKLEKAQAEEERGAKVSDPAVRLLRKHVHAGTGRVMGSDQARYQLRSQIWSTTIKKGPPSLWITINPSDIHDPIAQIFAGEKIDMDSFISTLGPNKEQRARNIAGDPYAAAKFFHFMIRTILETLFQIKVTKYQVKSGRGVLGRVSAYFGTVESQGRGTLHLHLLVWLEATPTSDELLTLLKSEEFRARIIAYIQANIRSYLPGLESAESIRSVPRETEIGYNRPPEPDVDGYEQNLKSFERRLARSEQVHTCKFRRCLFPDRTGRLVCKRKAPFKCAEEDFIDESGAWGSKRLYPYINGWLPAVLICARCNNDIKLLTNGSDTRNILFYVTSYAAKKQGKIHNLSAVLAQVYAYHAQNNHAFTNNLRETQRILIFRLIHAINREQEIALPMVISYLMGWGDTFRSHHYSAIYWSSFVWALTQRFPELQNTSS
jgi:Helitron helicase-like domain at N-terminus